MINKKHTLTLFSLTMITVGSVDSIRNLPATALFGSQLIAFFLLASVFFLIPCALVSAELASGWPKQGGVYVWVKQAFGTNTGFFAIWFQWIENVIWYPTILSFVAGTVGFLLNPAWVENKYFLISIILVSFWGATLINLRGMRSSARFSNVCAIAGLLIPMSLIIGLGVMWFVGGHPPQINFTLHDVTPSLHDKNMWVSLTAIILSFCGIEVATVHANDVKDPQKTFPRALAISVAIILITLVLGSLAIAIVLPHNQISLVAGIMQAFNAFFTAYHLAWLMPVIAFMLILGGLGGVSNWIIAPTKGLLVAAQDGNLPPSLQRLNRQDAPTTMLIAQAVIVSLLTAVFLFMPSVNGSYWLLTALTSQLYMLMYLLMFLAGIYLRIKSPHHPRSFKIPFGNWGMYIIGGMGLIGSLVTLLVGFIPPDDINVGTFWHYEIILSSGLIIMCLPPLVTILLRKQRWQLSGNLAME